MAWIQRRYGVDACRRYVISFTTSAQDIAAVYELAGYAFPDGDGPVLDVVPLFETGEDLANATSVLTGMLSLPVVTERLAATGRQLEVMLGYSDSAKELGPASATLRLFDAQAELAAWAACARREADLVPRPGRRDRPRRRPGRARRARPGARLGRRPAQGHRAGRGHLRAVRAARDRAAPPGAGHLGGAARLRAVGRGPQPARRRPTSRTWPRPSTTPRRDRSARWSRPTGSPSGSPPSARSRRSAACGSGPGRPAAVTAAARSAWRTCARSPGCSPGRRPG